MPCILLICQSLIPGFLLLSGNPVCSCVIVTEYDDEEEMEITTSDDVEVLNTFEGMGLREDLLRGIYAYGGYSL